MQIQQRKLKIPECSVEFNTPHVVEFSEFKCLSSCKTACDVDEVKVEQISSTSRALKKKMKKHFLGPWLEHSTSLGRTRTRNGEAILTEVSQTDNCD